MTLVCERFFSHTRCRPAVRQIYRATSCLTRPDQRYRHQVVNHANDRGGLLHIPSDSPTENGKEGSVSDVIVSEGKLRAEGFMN